MGIRDHAKQLGAANPRGQGNWITEGKGVLIVDRLKYGEKPEFRNGATFVGELVVESSASFQGAATQANPPGSRVTFLQELDANPEVAYDNMLAFVYALMGESKESFASAATATKEKLIKEGKLGPGQDWTAAEEIAQALEFLTHKDNPTRGMRVAYSTVTKTAKKSGKTLILPVFSHVKQTPEQIKATAAALDSAPPVVQ